MIGEGGRGGRNGGLEVEGGGGGGNHVGRPFGLWTGSVSLSWRACRLLYDTVREDRCCQGQ